MLTRGLVLVAGLDTAGRQYKGVGRGCHTLRIVFQLSVGKYTISVGRKTDFGELNNNGTAKPC